MPNHDPVKPRSSGHVARLVYWLTIACAALGILSSIAAAPSAALRTTAVVSPIQPTSIALLGAKLYIADPARQEILLRSPSGSFSVAAGTGVAGLSGDGGPAIRANIDDPTHLVALRDGAVFFEQLKSGREVVVREITPSGVIRTVVGLHPDCSGVTEGTTAIAAESARLVSSPLSVSADDRELVVNAQPCPHALQLGPFLRLTSKGTLEDIQVDRSYAAPLSFCGPLAGVAKFTALFCESGGGRPKRIVVLRRGATPRSYSTFGPAGFASSGGNVIAVRNGTIVRVTTTGLQTEVSTADLKHLVSGRNVPSVVALALASSGDVVVVADSASRNGCTATISEFEIAEIHRPRIMWSRLSRQCY